jgi:hypothetical protein
MVDAANPGGKRLVQAAAASPSSIAPKSSVADR